MKIVYYSIMYICLINELFISKSSVCCMACACMCIKEKSFIVDKIYSIHITYI